MKRWPSGFVSRSLAAGALAMAVALSPGADGSTGPDKSQYTLLNPTPREWMREMSTDRPDKTESAFTVDAGHFQVEADILSYSYDRYNPERAHERVESVRIAPINLKVGLCNSVDLQLVLETYTSVRAHDVSVGAVGKHRGFGDVLIRTKWNAWGNDRGATALAVMPYVKLPTNQHDLGNQSLEGGAIIPFAVELPAGWSLGLMAQLDVVRNAGRSGYHADFLNSITFGHDIIGDLAAYAEFFGAVSAESDSDWVGTVDLGITYGLTGDIQLDAGVNLGVTRAADDINPFIGISWRF